MIETRNSRSSPDELSEDSVPLFLKKPGSRQRLPGMTIGGFIGAGQPLRPP
jgi:hypothetical protein